MKRIGSYFKVLGVLENVLGLLGWE